MHGIRSEQRVARRTDRDGDRDAELTAYNQYLARLAAGSPPTGTTLDAGDRRTRIRRPGSGPSSPV